MCYSRSYRFFFQHLRVTILHILVSCPLSNNVKIKGNKLLTTHFICPFPLR